ncbi:MAG TPA: hypothetical protein VNC61_10315 [Acidimicrobiales bacterium]|nr:hypothetical protein [Acidimicrobiales bacterium]
MTTETAGRQFVIQSTVIADPRLSEGDTEPDPLLDGLLCRNLPEDPLLHLLPAPETIDNHG